MSLYTAQEIMDIIPHRYPFLLIDTIEELDPGVRALGRKCVSVNEPFFQGHFPGNPVMPGVLIIVLLLETEIIKVKGPIGVGRAVAKVGDKVAAQAELTFSIG